jgi:CheY-like chemotaxis protein
MTDLPADDILVRTIHRALRHLYEPVELRSSPLAAALGIARQGDVPSQLRKLLLAAIQSLQPDAKAPPDSTAWRIYQLLLYRFEEQFSQEETAAQMGVSVRQVRRLESAAIHALADLLISQYGVTLGGKDIEPAQEDGSPLPPAILGDEFDWLKKSYIEEITPAFPLIDSAIKVGEPLLREAAITLEAELVPGLPAVVGQATTLRQALLNLLIAARMSVGEASGAKVRLRASEQDQLVNVELWAESPSRAQADTAEYVESARRLVTLSGGEVECLTLKSGWVFGVCLGLKKAEQANILVIDDNEDILRLVQRCLEGTHYRFFGTRSPHQVLPLAEEISPQVILLDIMLPEVDGWEILGRLRAHPQLERVPVIITTVLPHQQLAAALGAAGFLRKPVRREELLALLEQLSGRAG